MHFRKPSLVLCLPLLVFALAGCPDSPHAPNPNNPPTPPISPVAPPRIALIDPGTGTLAGGTSITIYGENFVDVVSVTIGGQSLVELSVLNKSVITGKTPPGAPGTSDIVVTTAHGSTTRSAAYRYTSRFPLPYGSLKYGRDVPSAGVAVDSSGNVYVAGYTDQHFPGFINQGLSDLFVMKMDNDGALKWTQQLGTDGYDQPWDMAADSSGNVYVVGSTRRSFPGFSLSGGEDLYVIKFDSNGTRQWLQQLGTTGDDNANAVATDVSGNVYVVGSTNGAFPGYSNAGRTDLLVMKLSSAGAIQWIQQKGGSESDSGRGVATDGAGHVHAVVSRGFGVSGYVMKFDGTGAELSNTPVSANHSVVAIDSHGAFYVAAHEEEWTISKLGGNGAPQWTHPVGLGVC